MRNPGKIVQHEDGRIGLTFNYKGLINGKVPVHFEVGKGIYAPTARLVDHALLKLIGFID